MENEALEPVGGQTVSEARVDKQVRDAVEDVQRLLQWGRTEEQLRERVQAWIKPGHCGWQGFNKDQVAQLKGELEKLELGYLMPVEEEAKEDAAA